MGRQVQEVINSWVSSSPGLRKTFSTAWVSPDSKMPQFKGNRFAWTYSGMDEIFGTL
jgi:hypothetical protein